MIEQRDIDSVAGAARQVPPAQNSYIEDDYVTNLMSTVLDYQMHTTAVQKSLNHYKEHRWDDLRTREDLRGLFVRYPENREGNTALAQYLWGNSHWTRAQQLRDLTVFFRKASVVDQETLRNWAARSTFKRDFEARSKVWVLPFFTGW